MSNTKEDLHVGFIGNPNCGKTTLFNAYTGAKLKVANWPGVTVEKKEGAFKYHDNNYKLVDLPGIYSLTSYTMEEKLSRQYILSEDVDVIIDIVDASALERNLYLTLQLIELGKPVILALNMMDIVEERGMEIDLHRLPEMLGIPVIPVSARRKTGLDILMHAVAHHKRKPTDNNLEHHHETNEKESKHIHKHHKEIALVYSDEIEDKIDEITKRLKEKYGLVDNLRWLAIKLLEKDDEICNLYPDFDDIVTKNYETDIINQKYDFIEEIIEETVVNKKSKTEFTDKIDKVLTSNIWGGPIFFGIMALVFVLTFTLGDYFSGYLQVLLDRITYGVNFLLDAIHVNHILKSLIVDGALTGVGSILTFLPNIFILFLALAILEDSGYMSRVAYVMDNLMSKIGLSGRAFVPMLLGFGCSVPAVMSSRTLENMHDRRKTIFITPFMSCSAKLPVYILFSHVFLGKYAMIAAFSMYVLGIIIAILTALIIKLFDNSKNSSGELVIELPEYKKPNTHSILIYATEKVKDYLTKAGTTIFIASIIVWLILNFGPHGMCSNNVSASFGAMLGKVLSPIMKPAGLGSWQIIVALIFGIAGKETIVSSFGIIYGISNITSLHGMFDFHTVLFNSGFTYASAISLIVFALLYTPCIAAFTTMHKEFQSKKWTIFSLVYQLFIAWLLSTIAYQIFR